MLDLTPTCCWPTFFLQACPTASLAGGTIAQLDATTLGNAIKAALTNALFPGSNAVSSVALATDSLSLTAAAPASSTYTYSVVEVRAATAQWHALSAAGSRRWLACLLCIRCLSCTLAATSTSA